MTTYQYLIDKLFNINISRGKKLSLDEARSLYRKVGSPAENYLIVHVAGTNGKGSVSTKIAKALELSGKKVGLFTSPHITSFCERIKINGMMISENDVVRLLLRLFPLSEENTFFEITTMLAFLYFAEQNVDTAVIEVGLGGRFDATNVVTPAMTVITSISLDHCEILGDTIEKIAYEKAGIIKPKVPIVIGPNVPYEVIQKIVEEKGAPLVQCIHNTRDDAHQLSYDQENSLVASEALRQMHINEEFIRKGVLVRPSCRMEKMYLPGRCLPIILDVGHNPDGLKRLFAAVHAEYPNSNLHVICGLSKSKDVDECLRILCRNAFSLYLVEAFNGRAATVVELINRIHCLDLDVSKVSECASIEQALDIALNGHDGYNSLIIVCGTFFIMDSVIKAFK